MATKYLDSTGLAHFWHKIKDYVDAHSGSGISVLDCYPVGSYYETSDTTFDPNTAWGGTWSSETITDEEVIEEGTTGIWTYKKWSSGLYEAWGKYSATGMNLTSQSAGTYYTSTAKTVSLPSWSRACSYAWGNETSSQSSGVYIYNIVPSASSLSISYRAHASASNVSCGGMLYVIGEWDTYSAPTSQKKWHRTA